MSENASILHLDLDAFFVSVEQLKNSQLKHKPVIIGGDSGRGVVASCSYEARRFGVRSAMSMQMARRLCPDAVIIRGDMESYSKYSAMVTEIIRENAPLFEKASIDEFYLDLSGMDRFFGCYKWSRELITTICKETGLPLSFGLSGNKMMSKIGTGESKPRGKMYIPKGTEQHFIAPLTVNKIPMVGKKTYQQLVSMGVKKIKTLRQVPLKLLQAEFGKNGYTLWQRAHAIDPTPVIPYHEQKSISSEKTFDVDTTDVAELKRIIGGMTEKLAFELRKMHRLTACVTVKIRYSDFDTNTIQKKIAYTANDQILMKTACELFDKAYTRRLLIRLVGVRFSTLVNGNYQINMFEDSTSTVNLHQAMDKIRQKYGAKAVMRASGI